MFQFEGAVVIDVRVMLAGIILALAPESKVTKQTSAFVGSNL